MLNGQFYATFGGTPFYNMAFDEWMFERAILTSQLFILRLYTWSQSAVTFGCNQNEGSVVNHEYLNGTPLIRRITGGRALYHDPSELTYSIAVNDSCLIPGVSRNSISQTSRIISEGLMEFLKEIGFNAQYVRQSSPEFRNIANFHLSPCFESRARHEIVGGKGKIVASAQRRIENSFVQHGSIKINGVSDHPALPISIDNSLKYSVIRPISDGEFRNYEKSFVKIISEMLRVGFSSRSVTATEEADILVRAKVIEKNANEFENRIKRNQVEIGQSYD